jgi:hypothetical protein
VGEAEAAAVEVHDDEQAPALVAAAGDLGEVDPETGLPREVVQRVPVAGHGARFTLPVEKKIPEVTDKRVYRIYLKISRSKIKQNNT